MVGGCILRMLAGWVAMAHFPVNSSCLGQRLSAMSEKSGVTAQITLLPKDGGAWHGIGVKFLPALPTGTGNFTIPIILPLCCNGFQSQLNLACNTGNGNGYSGLRFPTTRRPYCV